MCSDDMIVVALLCTSDGFSSLMKSFVNWIFQRLAKLDIELNQAFNMSVSVTDIIPHFLLS